ncbi:glycosyltransferase family 39 protein [Bradyrhizobium japonicum]|uniref:glycosyltransferase family 39 protein n=1 Tax=Bradyrhizobium japonicum TaxID=375 RepID=UPI001BA59F3B|nr:glycosyltransferase family 39 protein [Bradyrhizobium japonicum]MBR0990885.1 glycosyltransferase family 39 protein [Bradyrhizobium japonicum]
MANGAGSADRSDWIRLSGLVLLAGLITAVVASRSLDASRLHGRLSVPPLYDDVAYFGDAVRWVNAFESRGVAGSVWDLLHHHAPFSTLVAATGFRLFPESYVGPYLVHAVLVFGFLLGIVWLVRRRPVLEIAACLVAAACVPVLWHTVTEARPDLPSGLAVGFAAGAVVYRGVLRRSTSSLAGLGVACALAACIKPTSFPAALALLGSTFAIRLVIDCIQAGGLRPSIRTALGALLWFVLPLVATTAVLIGPALVETVTYILMVFIGQRDLWTTGEGFWPGLLRFSIGGDGRFGLHHWFVIGVALMLLRFVFATIEGRAAVLDAVVLLATMLIAYAIPSVAEIKTYFFGAMFYGVFIVAIVLNGCACMASIESLLARTALAKDTRRRLLTAGRVLALAIAFALFVKDVVIGQLSIATSLSAQQQDSIRASTQRLWSLLRDVKPPPSGPLYVGFSSPYPVTPATIQLYAARAHINLVVRGEMWHRTAAATADGLLQSEIFVVSSSIQHTLIGPRVGDELIARMDADKGVCLLDSMSFPDVTLRVYRRGC